MTASLVDALPTVRGRYTVDAPLSKTTWFRTGGAADVVFKPADAEDLSHFLRNKPSSIPVQTIGVGSNLLVRDGGIRGVIIRLGKGFSDISYQNDALVCGAGVLDRNVALTAQKHALANMEFLAGIPGTIGGAIKMNAGAYGTEIADILLYASVMDPQGTIHQLTAQDLELSYRHSSLPNDWIVLGATFKTETGDQNTIASRIQQIMSERETTQPVKSRTGGSTFANPEGYKAWQLIDQAGCRGLERGGAQVSTLHCNFLINNGNATAADLEHLGEAVRQKVLETSNISLRWEIQRIGEFS